MEVVEIVRAGDPSPGSPYAQPCFRIPALVASGERLLLAYDVREDWRDLPGPFDIMLRTSDDVGRTWSAPIPFRMHDGSVGYGDASLIAEGDDVWCWYVSSDGPSFFTATAGHGLGLWLAHSVDRGETWTHTEVPGLRPSDVGGMFATSGNGIVLRQGPYAGRLLQPFVLRTQDGKRWAAVAASDDRGVTWTLGPRVGPDCDETKVVEVVEDEPRSAGTAAGPSARDGVGGVLLLARDRPRRRTSWSADGLTYSLPEPHSALLDPGCNGGAVTLPDERLVISLLDHETDRCRLVLRISDDAGLTWSPSIVVDPGAAAYSVLAVLPDGDLGLVYEVGDYQGIRFIRIGVDELGFGDDGQQRLESLSPSPGAAKPPVAGAAPSL